MKVIQSLIYSNRTGTRITRHTLFWLADMFNWLMVISIGRELSFRDLHYFLALLPVALLTTYFILYYILPRFNTADKGQALLLMAATLFMMGAVLRAYKYYVVIPWVGWEPIARAELWSLGAIISEIFKWLAVIWMAVAIKVIKSRTELQQKNDQLTLEKKAAELNFLKLQMNPHFLFNTLNTLYSETIQNTPRAGEVVMHLSNLMRFILEECNKPVISLQSEIKVIDDYIALEKLRHGARLNVSLALPNGSAQATLSPLVFLPFIENAFKHSLTRVRGTIAIDIRIDVSNDRVMLSVENDQDKTVGVQTVPSGVGISNIQRQLHLLYGDDHSLKVTDMDKRYRVELQIPSHLKQNNHVET